MSKSKHKLSNFKYHIQNFFYNIKLFFPLLIGYRWYEFDYGLDSFLKLWLQDGVKHFSEEDECTKDDHLKCAEKMSYALELLSMLEDDFYFIDEDKRNFSMVVAKADEKGLCSVSFEGKTPTKKDYDTAFAIREMVKRDLFSCLSKNYESWWD